MSRRIKLVGVMVIMFISGGLLNGQAHKQTEIFETLKVKDNEMFAIGFNQCNIKRVEKLTHSNFEFYHDKDGITGSKKAFIKAIENDLCAGGENVITRVLDESSLEVFPMYRGEKLYGAIQTGTHSFGNTSAQFTHLWLIENGDWKISRVLSFNHHSEKIVVDDEAQFLTMTADELSKYVGKYRFSPDFVLSMILEKNKLYGDSQGEKVEIKPYEKHKFIAIDNSVKVHFNVGDNGKVTGLIMVTQEGEMSAEKVK